MTIDTISDMLTRIRNANMIKHRIVKVNNTKMTRAISKILKEEGFIENFETCDQMLNSYLLLSLKYRGELRKPVIEHIERISKPGLRIYVSSKEIPKVLENLGIAIMSTSKGLMTNMKAKELKLGGEILCYIW